MAVYQSALDWLTLRYREQARSHSCFVYDLNPLTSRRILIFVAIQE